jgi:isopenicillin N synthase-like dioxygenase
MVEIDPDFIQAPEHRPKLNVIEAENIPVIDLSPILNNSNNIEKDPLVFDELVRKIGSACKEWGFFQVINHGAPLESRQKIESVGKKFFGQKMEEKKKVRRDHC